MKVYCVFEYGTDQSLTGRPIFSSRKKAMAYIERKKDRDLYWEEREVE